MHVPRRWNIAVWDDDTIAGVYAADGPQPAPRPDMRIVEVVEAEPSPTQGAVSPDVIEALRTTRNALAAAHDPDHRPQHAADALALADAALATTRGAVSADLSRREMFDALPIEHQQALPTWPLPTYAQVRFVYDRWRGAVSADPSTAELEMRGRLRAERNAARARVEQLEAENARLAQERDEVLAARSRTWRPENPDA